MHLHAHTRTHTDNCGYCSSDLLCYRADVTAHHHHWSRPAPQKTGRAPPSGPVCLSETHRGVRETGRRTTILAVTPNTDRRARNCGQRSAAAHPKDSRNSVRFQSPSSPGLNRAAPSLAVGRPDPLCGKTKDATD